MSSKAQNFASLLANMVGPWLGYEFLTRRGWSEFQALLALTIIPLFWGLGVLVRQRRLDLLACMSATSMVLSLLACLWSSDIRALQVRDSYITLLFGLLFCGSVVVRRPIITVLALAQTPPERREQTAEFFRSPRGFRFMAIITMVWGLVSVAEFGVKLWMIFTFPISTVLWASPWVLNGMVALTALWTFGYVRYAKRQGEARREAEARELLAMHQQALELAARLEGQGD